CVAALQLARAQDAPVVVVGAVVSQSGPHADLAAGYRKALLLWQDEVNAAGGLLGRRVELRLLDDGSAAARCAPLYAQLIRDEKAELLIGPYGSAATRVAAAEAERQRRVMINGAGPAHLVHKGATRYLFQSGAPYAAQGAGVLELARAQGLRTLFILARDELASREMAEAARAAALGLGFTAGEVTAYSGSTTDFTAQVAKAQAAQADAWIAFGEVRDAAEMVKTFKRAGYAPRLFFARKATDPAFVAAVGQDAEFSLGAVEYDPRLASAANSGFAKAFAAKWSAQPGPGAAEGYAAATVLAEAVRRAGSFDQEKLRAALASLETDTVLGSYRVDAASGEQVGIKPAVAQIQRGRPEVVWPNALQTAQPLLPYPQWGERRLLKN
ncbi:MAG TPA: ABC transporter substrate-binding protein, partial [Burkholderiales bacterium]|nr:ABC transporter substrate-binding protein [Burkholderiales bacterium]